MKTRSLLYLAVIVLLAGCSGSKIKVTDTNFSNEVDRLQNLVFKFNEPIAPDSLFDKWDTVNYIQFKPALKGRFKWTSAEELIFSPSQPLPPSSTFEASLTGELSKLSASHHSVSDKVIQFHTAFLELKESSAYWAYADDGSHRIEIRVTLSFNYEVDPNLVAKLLTISQNDRKLELRLITSGLSAEVAFAVVPFSAKTDKAFNLTLKLAPGLQCPGSNYKLTEGVSKSVEVPSPEKFSIVKAEPEFNMGEGVLSIYTTQPVGVKDLAKYITITPAINYTTELLPNGFKLVGPFIEDQAYSLRIAPELKSVFDIPLNDVYVQSILFTNPQPLITFTDKQSTYLTSKGNRNLGLKIVNVPKLKITAFKIFENNLQQYFKNGMEYDYADDGAESHEMTGYPLNEDYGRKVYEKEIDTRKLTAKGSIRLLNINLDEINYKEKLKGIYLFKVESADKRWIRDIQLVSVSDIGLIVKQGVNKIMVFANSIKDAKPMAGVKIDFISRNNQKVYSALTNGMGVAVLDNIATKAKGFTIGMISATLGDDFNFLMYDRSSVEMSRFDIAGKRTFDHGLDVFVYGDRDLYRPGDSVYINTLVRSIDLKTVQNIPLKVKIVAPNGKAMLYVRRNLNKQGATETRFSLPADIMTGVFTIEVLSGNDVLLQSKTFKVEDFMPERISLTAKADKPVYQPGQNLLFTLKAANLFGTPAADRKYELELVMKRKAFKPKGFDDYVFNITDKNEAQINNLLRSGKTSAEGVANETIPLPAFTGIGMIEGKLYTSVFDENGRPVNRLVTFDLATQNAFFGIRDFDSWVSTQNPVRIGLTAVNANGEQLRNARTTVKVIHYTWENVLEKTGTSYHYNSLKREKEMMSKTIDLTASNNRIDFTPYLSGQYEVRVYSPGSISYVSKSFYAYRYGDTQFSSFPIDRKGQVKIQADKPEYHPGEKARMLITAPFSGRLLVTIERGEVMEQRYIDLKEKAGSFEFTIKDEHVPNVYISALAFRAADDQSIPVTVAHGAISIKVNAPRNHLTLGITAPEKAASKTQQIIKIKTQPNAELTIAAVDEGILQMTDYVSPDPYAWYFQKRALEVATYDLYAEIFPELAAKVSSFGGDAAFMMGKRANPLTNKRVKPFAIWSGIIKADSRGEASFKLNIPQFSGAVRVMAVAYDQSKFAASEKTIKIADDIVISSGVPRFLSPNDQLKCPVTLTNTTEKPLSVSLSVKTAGPVKPGNNASKTIQIPSRSERSVVIDLIALNQIGTAKIMIEVTAGEKKYNELTDLTVRPAAGLTKISRSGSVRAGGSVNVNTTDKFIPSTVSSSLLVSKSPMVAFASDLQQLLEYPYGCMEQTISAAFPLIYYGDLVKLQFTGPKGLPFVPTDGISLALHKIDAQQIFNGGILLWPSASEADWWSTVYATHFMLEAQRNGYDVNPTTLDGALKYLVQKLRQKEMFEDRYIDPAGQLQRIVRPKREIFYSLLVLALNGHPEMSAMNYYKSKIGSLTVDSRYMLAAAYALAGDRQSYASVLPKSFTGKSVRETGGSYASAVRDRAISLYALIEADKTNPAVGALTLRLTEAMKAERWMSTQDRAFALLAIGKVLKEKSNEKVTARILLGENSIGEFTEKDLRIKSTLFGKRLSISASGNGSVYYFYNAEGIGSSAPVGNTDKQLQVRKRFLDRTGREISNQKFTVNDLVVIEVTLRSADQAVVNNVVVTDLLPACFEIENPRISAIREYQWIKEASIPDYMDIRDDRISYFTKADGTKERKFYYMVRVVSKGIFNMGPVSADAMYSGDIYSYSGAGSITVE
ncbi:MAG: alpha-2-macroglobulin family protein [Bacteroidetes bacterium]|nr:alpha-2-macroglobulin family protein [Bacteroidota bacterium]